MALSAAAALARLQEGNRLFVADLGDSDAVHTRHVRRSELVADQEPFAIVLGCSDSRVPAELVFGQGIGDLFVIRVAGNVVAPSQIGSVEFAATAFQTRLVVVLGHTRCGAILTTVSELQRPAKNRSRNLGAIVDRVRPSIESLLATDLKHDHDALVREAVRANIRKSVNDLQRGSQIIQDLTANHGLAIVGAEYNLDTGVVEYIDDETGHDNQPGGQA